MKTMFTKKTRARLYRNLQPLIALSLAVLFSSVSNAASPGERIKGTVVDPSGAAVADARVVLRDKPGRAAHVSRTDSEGRFEFANVAASQYVLTAEAEGFTQVERLVVGPGSTDDIIVRLAVAAISDHTVVTATRTDTPIAELAGSVSVLGQDELKRENQSLVSESLRQVPGLVVTQSGGRGGLTTIFARGGESDYNKVLIDGVPVNQAGGLFDFSALTPENLDRIEVVRGPRSALFGSDAMTSVIQLFTRRGATSTPELELSAEGGNLDFHREVARLSGLAGWFDYSASFGFQSTSGRFDNNDFINRSASLNLGFQLAPSAELRLTSRWNNNTAGVPGPVRFLFVDPDERQKHRDIAFAATFDWATTSRWSQTARLTYSEFDTLSFDPAAQDLLRPGQPPQPFGTDFATRFQNHQKRAGFQYQTIAALTNSNVLTAGIDFERESAAIVGDFSRSTPDRDNLGFYVQDQFSVRERLFVTAGVRLERNAGGVPADLSRTLESLGSPVPSGDVGFGFAANPKIAVTVLARRHNDNSSLGATRLKASFGTGIKEASLDEAFSPSSFFLGNPSLDPERVVSFDLGSVQEFLNRRVSLEFTYFDNRFRDLIIFTLDPLTFGPVRLPDGRLTNFINLERASARGIELVGAARPFLKMRLGASYTYLRSLLERGEAFDLELGLPLVRRPRHSGAFDISWVDRRFDLTLDGSIVGRRRDIDPVSGARFDLSGRPFFNDGYAKVNLAGSYHVTRSLTAFARVENLFNEDYEEILGFPAQRLNFSVGLRLRIGGKD